MSLVEALPQEIVVRITSRLPVKSIINCMLVCKLWRTLIPNPLLTKHNPKYFLLYNVESAKFAILDHDYDDPSCVTNDQIIPMKPSFPNNGSSERLHIWGSCNGLICFSQTLKHETLNIHIYNPTIGESVTLPKPSSPNYSSFERYAFGFCPITNHYEVFRSALHLGSNNNNYNNVEVEIYTLGSHRWRHIGQVPRLIWVRSPPICDRGVLHWIWSEENRSKYTSIFTFNLATEEFGCAAPPPIGQGKEMWKLGYMDRCLIVAAGRKNCLDSDVDIWVRREWTWSKNWVVRDNHIGSLRYDLVPLAILVDGIILMIRQSFWLYSFDPNKKHGTALDNVNVPDLWVCLFPYDATLVCPRDLMKEVSL